jgi:hypothetical protein
MKINYMENPYSFWETERLQDELVELDCFIQDTQHDPDTNRIAQTHKFLAEVALFERIL